MLVTALSHCAHADLPTPCRPFPRLAQIAIHPLPAPHLTLPLMLPYRSRPRSSGHTPCSLMAAAGSMCGPSSAGSAAPGSASRTPNPSSCRCCCRGPWPCPGAWSPPLPKLVMYSVWGRRLPGERERRRPPSPSYSGLPRRSNLRRRAGQAGGRPWRAGLRSSLDSRSGCHACGAQDLITRPIECTITSRCGHPHLRQVLRLALRDPRHVVGLQRRRAAVVRGRPLCKLCWVQALAHQPLGAA